MTLFFGAARVAIRVTALAAAIVGLQTLSGCFAQSFYLDSTLGDLNPEQKNKVHDPQPVQLMFEFQSKGIVNARGTESLKEYVTNVVHESGFFAAITTDPIPSGAVLRVVIDDEFDADNAARQGANVVRSLGRKSATIEDDYICTVEFIKARGAKTISATARTSIYTTIGSTGPPPNSTYVENAEIAVRTVVRRTVARTVNELASDPTSGLWGLNLTQTQVSRSVPR